MEYRRWRAAGSRLRWSGVILELAGTCLGGGMGPGQEPAARGVRSRASG